MKNKAPSLDTFRVYHIHRPHLPHILKFIDREFEVIYINLDDGSYYEVPSYSLDLNGRIFARDIFELFRQKWEGAF